MSACLRAGMQASVCVCVFVRACVSCFFRCVKIYNVQYNTVQDEMVQWYKIRNKVDRSRSSRRVQSYSFVGTWPSAVARVMSGTRIWWWREDLLPRTHIMAESRVAKDSRHLSQPITVEYGFCCFPAIMSASPL